MKDWLFHPGTALVGAGVRLLGGATVIGLDNIPQAGGCLVASNHVSDLDPPILAWALGHQRGRVIYFMAKDEMRRWPVLGWLLAQHGVFYVRRGEADRGAQRLALRLLSSGGAVGVFPEGTRSRTGRLGTGNPGLALLAMRTGVPIVPVAITGTRRLFPPGARMVRRAHVTIRVGDPLSVEHRPKGRIEREELDAFTETAMRAIAALLPAEMRGPYGYH
ncbi:MAG: 1-acyl-sn-glycerol-3-phosphate acyltransferase [Chloroflexota bacterium]|nr:1-acyl-sn-glycerol-3-phosphate acyltransferase [Chloroflexota bacterium]